MIVFEMYNILIYSRTGRNRLWEDMDVEHFANFQKEFPAHRAVLEKCIRCLQEIADRIDTIHKDCTIANITASSAGATSDILSILGLTLAPFSAGVSLILTATGIGLGAAAAAAGISASVSEYVIDSEDLKKVQALMNECKESLRLVMHPDEFDFSPESTPSPTKLVKKAVAIYSAPEKFKANVKALKVARANPELTALAQQATAVGIGARAAMTGVEEVESSFRGTALAMTKGARMLSAASAGFFFLYDAYSLIQGVIHLTEGAKADVAAQIRDKANKLEEALQELNKLYEELNEED
ncbi:apolipoprotein L2 [Pogona vitticeps]